MGWGCAGRRHVYLQEGVSWDRGRWGCLAHRALLFTCTSGSTAGLHVSKCEREPAACPR